MMTDKEKSLFLVVDFSREELQGHRLDKAGISWRLRKGNETFTPYGSEEEGNLPTVFVCNWNWSKSREKHGFNETKDYLPLGILPLWNHIYPDIMSEPWDLDARSILHASFPEVLIFAFFAMLEHRLHIDWREVWHANN